MSSPLSCYSKKIMRLNLKRGDLTLMLCPYLIQLLVLFVFFGMSPPHRSSSLCFLCAPTLTGAGTGQWCRCRRSGGNCRCIHGIGGSRTGGFKASTKFGLRGNGGENGIFEMLRRGKNPNTIPSISFWSQFLRKASSWNPECPIKIG